MTIRPTRLTSSVTGATYERCPDSARTSSAAALWLDVDDGRSLAQAPWRALCPPHVVELRDPTTEMLRRLPSGTDVALLSDSHVGRARLRRRAALAGVCVDRELIVVPSTYAPIVVLDDSRSAVRHFWSAVATVPPGLTRAHAPASAVLLLARYAPWPLTGLLARGRVLVGRRS